MLITRFSPLFCGIRLRSGPCDASSKSLARYVSAFKCRHGVVCVSLTGWLTMAGVVVAEELCLGDAFVYPFVRLKRVCLAAFKLTCKGDFFRILMYIHVGVNGVS
jgi:hypothetical protein